MDDDWSKPTIFKKRPEKGEGAPRKPAPVHDPTRKVLEEDFPTVARVRTSVSQAIMQGRQALGITRKELSAKVQEKEQVICEYENGVAIPNQQILAKLERVLGVKLRGDDIGQKLISKSAKSHQ